ncbi:hypothetical protein [Mesorhizobium sp.]|uniref:hypothetical protein n=1 Tax=Mesorhizobium sp. TaxID=1871066 RepID=UPI000FE528B9|nr:hypothetical protein [Mesorhizobium sp.]RWC56451.1 MAG: hypothetical protein EOS29_25990 [Mesorhizobium sp.]RWC58602.1 MAG: hypothetical protein EOS56_18910 [Mesorhizobium sp.]
MSERTSDRLGLLESTAIVLAVAVACMVMARAEPVRRCAATIAPISRDFAPEKSAPEADATDMLLHD